LPGHQIRIEIFWLRAVAEAENVSGGRLDRAKVSLILLLAPHEKQGAECRKCKARQHACQQQNPSLNILLSTLYNLELFLPSGAPHPKTAASGMLLSQRNPSLLPC
jgi:hypothetical protein